MKRPKSKKGKHPRPKVLKAFSEGLDELKANFEIEFVGIETPEAENSQQESTPLSEADEEEDEYGEDEDFAGPSTFDREDIEVSVDVFLSHLVHEGVIKDSKIGEQPSFSEVFERFFGEDHEIAKKARDFEENIEGYFDVVSYDDVRKAYGDLVQMKDIIEAETANP
jgi:hypothetical protein